MFLLPSNERSKMDELLDLLGELCLLLGGYNHAWTKRERKIYEKIVKGIKRLSIG